MYSAIPIGAKHSLVRLFCCLPVHFFISYPIQGLSALLVSFFGYVAIACFVLLLLCWKSSFPHLSNILFGGSPLLFYYAAPKLSFFTSHQVMQTALWPLLP